MISDRDLPELRTYRRVEKTLPLEIMPELADLVVWGENESVPIHRWFRYKEAYSANLLGYALSLPLFKTNRRLSILDPYCGVGTGLLSAQVLPDKIETAIGIERNPFVSFVARSKLAWPEISLTELAKISAAALDESSVRKCTLPQLSGIKTGRCITKHISARLLSVRDTILEFRQSAARDALLVGLASAIEPLSRVRKDGRALRLVSRSHQHVTPVLRQKWQDIVQDVRTMQEGYPRVAKTSVMTGDGRMLALAGVADNSVDLVLTSPPYPNNIDYSEVYKLELWLLGFICNNTDFLKLRKSTVRSHPTSDLDEQPEPEFLSAIRRTPLSVLFGPLLERTQALEERWRTKLALAYFADIWRSLIEQYRSLRRNGRAILIIGNSLHGRPGSAYLIPTDLMLAKLGEAVGFELEQILVARNTRRRLSGNHFLRESIVVLRKPAQV